jgi:hypothetical protein
MWLRNSRPEGFRASGQAASTMQPIIRLGEKASSKVLRVASPRSPPAIKWFDQPIFS